MMLSNSHAKLYTSSMSPTEQLRRIIESSGLSRYEIAKRSGVSQGTLSKLMAGLDVTTRTLDALAPVLRIRLVVAKSTTDTKATKASTKRKAGR